MRLMSWPQSPRMGLSAPEALWCMCMGHMPFLQQSGAEEGHAAAAIGAYKSTTARRQMRAAAR